MRAAVLEAQDSVPTVVDFDEPASSDGSVLIHLETAGLGAWDILGMYREGISFPCVIRGEGVGHTDDGRHVYFGERSVAPFGAWAERTLVPPDEVWDIPDGVDDATAITMAIAGTGAYVPIEQARIQPGENVLVLGATGSLGQVALQLARVMGAGRVVGAARNQEALERLVERNVADATVALGSDAAADGLMEASHEGFDVVIDAVYGEPLVAALKATRLGARIMCLGIQAGPTATIFAGDLLFRTITTVGTGQRPAADRQKIWLQLLALAAEHTIVVEHVEYGLDQADEAWQAQRDSPHAKILGRIS